VGFGLAAIKQAAAPPADRAAKKRPYFVAVGILGRNTSKLVSRVPPPGNGIGPLFIALTFLAFVWYRSNAVNNEIAQTTRQTIPMTFNVLESIVRLSNI
jgi:hypothetical protein